MGNRFVALDQDSNTIFATTYQSKNSNYLTGVYKLVNKENVTIRRIGA